MRVLIAEDQPRVAGAVARGLRREGLAVDIAADGAEALLKARVTRYDVVILDRDLPEVHGDDVCRALTAERPETRVLMLTAASGVEDRVEGLALGADDYLPKPFAFAELVARVRALGRRAGPARPPVLERDGIVARPRPPRGAPRRRARRRCRRRSTPSSRCSWRPTARSCPPRSCSSARGTSRSIR